MPVHPGTAAVEQDRAAHPACDSTVDDAADGRGQWYDDDLGALAAYAQDPVAVFFAQIADAGAGGFEDPQAQQPEHGHQREVMRVRGISRCPQQRLELQVGEAERGRLGWDLRPADVLGRECSSTPSITQVR